MEKKQRNVLQKLGITALTGTIAFGSFSGNIPTNVNALYDQSGTLVGHGYDALSTKNGLNPADKGSISRAISSSELDYVDDWEGELTFKDQNGDFANRTTLTMYPGETLALKYRLKYTGQSENGEGQTIPILEGTEFMSFRDDFFGYIGDIKVVSTNPKNNPTINLSRGMSGIYPVQQLKFNATNIEPGDTITLEFVVQTKTELKEAVKKDTGGRFPFRYNLTANVTAKYLGNNTNGIVSSLGWTQSDTTSIPSKSAASTKNQNVDETATNPIIDLTGDAVEYQIEVDNTTNGSLFEQIVRDSIFENLPATASDVKVTSIEQIHKAKNPLVSYVELGMDKGTPITTNGVATQAQMDAVTTKMKAGTFVIDEIQQGDKVVIKYEVAVPRTADSDGDGLSDQQELAYAAQGLDGNNPCSLSGSKLVPNPDEDPSDPTDDMLEICATPDGMLDSDGDGRSNSEEAINGYDLFNSDQNSNGILDGQESFKMGLNNDFIYDKKGNKKSTSTAYTGYPSVKKTSKTASGDKIISPGEEVNYNVEVTNFSNGTAYAIPVRDSLYEILSKGNGYGFSLVPGYKVVDAAGNAVATTGDLAAGTLKITKLPVGQKAFVQFTTKASTDVRELVGNGSSRMTNVVTIDGTEPTDSPNANGKYSTTSAKSSDTIDGQAEVMKSVIDQGGATSADDNDKVAQQGETLTYTIDVSNQSGADHLGNGSTAFKVPVRDNMLEQLLKANNNTVGGFQLDPTSIMRDGAVLSAEDVEKVKNGQYVLSEVKDGQHVLFTYQIKAVSEIRDLAGNKDGQIINTVTIEKNPDGTPKDPNTVTDPSTNGKPSTSAGTITNIPGQAQLTKAVADANNDGQVQAGEALVYTVDVFNQKHADAADSFYGNGSDALNVPVRDTLLEKFATSDVYNGFTLDKGTIQLNGQPLSSQEVQQLLQGTYRIAVLKNDEHMKFTYTLQAPMNNSDYSGNATTDANGDGVVDEKDSKGYLENIAGLTETKPTWTQDNPFTSKTETQLLGSLSGDVWYDGIESLKDDVRSASESLTSMRSNVPVTLYEKKKDGTKVLLATALTDASGHYYFGDLDPSKKYEVVVTPPAGLKFVNQNSGTSDEVDSDVDLNGVITDIKVEAGKETPHNDAGLTQPTGSLSGYTWLDADRNGLRDDATGNTELAGVTVKLLDATGQPVLDATGNPITTTTDVKGYYRFDKLVPATYGVEFVQPDGTTVSQNVKDAFPTVNQMDPTTGLPYTTENKNPGTDPADEKDSDAVDSKVMNIVVEANQESPNNDAGFVLPLGSLSGNVFIDENRDGVNDPAVDTAYPAGVTVKLLDASGNPVLDSNGTPITTKTDANGHYEFTDLDPTKTYRTEITKPTDYSFTDQNKKDGDTNPSDSGDSDVNPAGVTGVISVVPGKESPSNDAGLVVELGSLSGYTWLDADRNGLRDDEASKTNLEGVLVKLLDAAGQPVLDSNKAPITTTTDANGFYKFDKLVPATYGVEFVQPDGTTVSQNVKDAFPTVNQMDPTTNLPYTTENKNPGTDPADEKDSDVVNSKVTNIVVKSNQESPNNDAGFVLPLGSLSGNVFIDENRDGVNDPAVDTAYPAGTEVKLLEVQPDGSTKEVGTTKTDANGHYVFTDLDPTKTYRTTVTKPTDYSFTDQNKKDGDTNPSDSGDSDVNDKGETGNITVTPGKESPSNDAGLVVELGSLSGYTWLDADRNGLRDDEASKTNLEGVLVKLLDAAGQPVLDSNKAPITTTTDANGFYKFDKLVPATYGVEFVQPDGTTVSQNVKDAFPTVKQMDSTTGLPYTTENKNPGTDPADEKDSDAVNSKVTNIVVKSNQESPNNDAGFVLPLGSLSGNVFIDENRDGVNDPAVDTAYPAGTEVKLLEVQPDGSTKEVGTTKTDANGHYVFTDIDPTKTYRTTVTKPTDYAFTDQNKKDGANNPSDGGDSDVNDKGETGNITVTPGKESPSNDAGLVVELGSLSGYTWLDADRNGLRDDATGNTELAGVTVKLLDATGQPVLDSNKAPITTTTDANGFYKFDNLVPATYGVEFVQPNGTTVSQNVKDAYPTVNNMDPTTNLPYTAENKNPGTDPADEKDSDAVNSKVTNIVVKSNQESPNNDAGFVLPLGSLSGNVFIDENRDGVNDPAVDTAYPAGTEVKLLEVQPDGSTKEVGTTKTDANGHYEFTDLDPTKTYRTEITKPTDYSFTDQNKKDGANNPSDGGDSDVNDKGETGNITVTPGKESPSNDAGLVVELGSLSGYTWLDADRNGLRDDATGNTELAGVTVKLLDATGQPVLDSNKAPITTTTDANGFYKFDNLVPATYGVEFVQPNGTTVSQNVKDAYPTVNNMDPTTNLPYTAENKNPGTDPADEKDSDAVNSKVTNIVVKSNQESPNNDAGFVLPLGSLSGNVFIDNNRDGINDPAVDTAYPAGTEVKLLEVQPDGSTKEVGTTKTDANGHYVFTDIDPTKTYRTTVTKPTDYSFTDQNKKDGDTNPSDSGDSDVNPAGVTGVISVVPGKESPSNDAGLVVELGSLSGYTWLDADRNGLRDDATGNTELAGVTVKLLDASGNPVLDSNGAPITTTTDASGFYKFDKLVPATYGVEFVQPNGTTVSQNVKDAFPTVKQMDPTTGLPYTAENKNSGTDPADEKDSDAVNSKVMNIVVKSNQESPNNDAGFVLPLGSLSGKVFIDNNRDGINDPAVDTAYPAGTEVKLLDASGNPVLDSNGTPITTKTDATGNYVFKDLDPTKTYRTEITKPTDYSFTDQNKKDGDTNPSDSGDSDVNPAGVTGVISVVPGKESPSNDAGLVVELGSLSGYTWLDADRNGLRDDATGNTELAGVTVKLLDASGNPVLDSNGAPITTTTDASGFYKFDKLAPATYGVEFVQPNGTTVSQNVKDAFPTVNEMDPTTGLPYTAENKNPGTDPADEKDSDAVNSKVTNIVVKSNQESPNNDAGFVLPLGSLSGNVFIDNNRDGINDPAVDTAYPAGVTVKLLDASGNPVLDSNGTPIATVTDANGHYVFTDLDPTKTYRTEITKPTDYSFTDQNKKDGDTNPSDSGDSDVNPAGVTGVISVVPGKESPSNDAGLVKQDSVKSYGSLSGYTWLDADRNGLRDDATGKTELAGVVVNLLDEKGQAVLDSAGKPITTTTDASGFYHFDKLVPGKYAVQFARPNGTSVSQNVSDAFPTVKLMDSTTGLPYTKENVNGNTNTSDANDSDALASTGQIVDISVEANKETPNNDAGFVLPLGSLSGNVFIDNNRDGINDPAVDTAYPAGVTVKLLEVQPDGTTKEVGRTKTDGAGHYEFKDLDPTKTYRTLITQPADYTFTDQNKQDGANNPSDSGDSDVNPSGETGNISVVPGKESPNNDAGIMKPIVLAGSLSGRVWIDENKDGKYDASEFFMPGVTVVLYDKKGNELQTTTTDSKGNYQFKNLPEGDYDVVVQKPNNYQFTVQNAAGVSNEVNSDVTPEGRISDIHVTAGTETPNNDAGLLKPTEPKILGSLSGQVWIDENNDGKFEITEVLVPNVAVVLLDSTGKQLQTASTDAKGFYQFKNLPEGDYSVIIQKPSGYQFTIQNADGVSKEINSDVVVTTGNINNIHVVAGQNTPNNDAGLVKQETPQLLGSLSGRVWIDENKDGKYDESEFLVPNITVVLFDKNGNKIQTITTDAKGFYQFKNLPEGDYGVVIQKPENYRFTVQNAEGITKELNSDVDITTGKITFVHVVAGKDTPNNDAGLVVPVETPPTIEEGTTELLPDTGNNKTPNIGYSSLLGLGVFVALFKKRKQKNNR